ncbi:E3 ubiquitin-protein ligase PPP1R11-like [Ptychodera flava]|uniref:E3 ubiquitin-protein ligase PPP1R11-like n=1 Tax=Ptychodera flava TaxID=63121 RepID=UPI00396A85E8
MATITKTTSKTVTESRSPNVTLKLRKPKTNKEVKWGEGTIDNEHMNKKKSKCCCVYEKPRAFGESSSEDSDDDCNHCRGHKKKANPNFQSPPNQDLGPEDAS